MYVETSTSSSGGGITPTPWAIINPSLPFTDTKTLGYSTSEWGDLLTSFNGTTITYDAIGNPLSYYNGIAYTSTWEGRRLVEATKGSNIKTDDASLKICIVSFFILQNLG